MLRYLATLALAASALFAVPTAAHAAASTPDVGGCRLPSTRACPAPTDPTPHPRWIPWNHREPICHRPVVCGLAVRVLVAR